MEARSPRAAKAMRIIGPGLLVLAVLLLIGAFVAFANIPDAGPPTNSPEWQEASDAQSRALLGAVGLGFGAAISFAFGVMVTQVGFLKPLAEYMARETGGAVEHASTRGGRGLGKGLKESGVTEGLHGRTIVKVRCRSCGAVDDEDAKFCSACGKAM